MKMREKMGYSDKSNQNALSAPSCFVSSRKQWETYVVFWLLCDSYLPLFVFISKAILPLHILI